MTRVRLFVSLLAVSVAPLLSGCPSNFCLLTVNGRCEMSSCGSGQHFDDQRKLCVCDAGRIALGGGCLTQGEANAHCGRGAIWTPQGCAAPTCPPGFIADFSVDRCVAKSAVDKAAGVAPGQTLACAPGTTLVVNGGQSACVPAAQTCARDEQWNGQACAKLPTCGPGFDLDPASHQCVQVARPPTQGDELSSVDVVQWSRSSFGVDGGLGAPGLCGPLAKRPLSFGVLAGGSARVVVAVRLSFPSGLTDGATVVTVATVEASGQPVLPAGAQETQAAAETLTSSLRGQKAHASAPSVLTTVRCLIVNGSAPVSVPSTGGALSAIVSSIAGRFQMKLRSLALLVSLVGGCASATPSPDPPPPPAEPAPKPVAAPKPPEDVPDTRAAPPASAAKTTGRAPPPGEEETRTMTSSQCKTLEAIVGGLVHKEAIARIDPKLSPELHQKAENGAVDAARTVSEHFRDNCLDNLVGKPIRRETLDCMLKARDFAAFGGCNK